jgi:hypothetical protein
MDSWADIIYPELVKKAAKDKEYQEYRKACDLSEREYTRLYKTFSNEQKSIVDKYISTCEDMDFRMMQLAFWYGVENC